MFLRVQENQPPRAGQTTQRTVNLTRGAPTRADTHRQATTWGKTWPHTGNLNDRPRGLPVTAYGENLTSADTGVVSDEDEPRPFDLARMVEVFNRHGVSYIAIGGVSGLLHGMIHYVTQDVDMMVRSSRENLERILSARTDLAPMSPRQRLEILK